MSYSRSAGMTSHVGVHDAVGSTGSFTGSTGQAALMVRAGSQSRHRLTRVSTGSSGDSVMRSYTVAVASRATPEIQVHFCSLAINDDDVITIFIPSNLNSNFEFFWICKRNLVIIRFLRSSDVAMPYLYQCVRWMSERCWLKFSTLIVLFAILIINLFNSMGYYIP